MRQENWRERGGTHLHFKLIFVLQQVDITNVVNYYCVNL